MNGTKGIKILHFVFDLKPGGIANSLVRAIPVLRKKFDIEVAYCRSKPETIEKIKCTGLDPINIHYNGRKNLIRASKELAKLVVAHKIDVVFNHFFTDKVITAIARRMTSFKICSILHSVKNDRSSQDWKAQLVIFYHNHIADRNFAVSEAVLSSWIKYKRLKQSNSKVLYSGIQQLPYQVNEFNYSSEKTRIFVTTCRITKVKGLERAIAYFELLNKYDSTGNSG